MKDCKYEHKSNKQIGVEKSALIKRNLEKKNDFNFIDSKM